MNEQSKQTVRPNARASTKASARGSSSQVAGHLAVEGDAGVLIARLDGGPHALFDATMARELKELVDRADRDPEIHAVVFIGTHPDRFLSHSDVAWLQQGGTGFPPINTRLGRLPQVRRDSSTESRSSEPSQG